MLKVISAAKFEVKHLLEALNHKGIQYEYTELGVGVFESLKTIHQKLPQFKDDKVIFVGSCGTQNEFHAPETFEIQKLSWLPLAERTQLAHRIEGCDPDIAISTMTSLPKRHVVCSSNLSLTNKGLSEDQVENIETYGVVRALMSSTQKVHVFLTSTNQVGPKGHDQWVKHFKNAAKVVANDLSHAL